MGDVKVRSLETIEHLQAKVEEAVHAVADLSARCETVEGNNALLRERVEALQHRNIALSREIDELRSATNGDEGATGEEIIKRIDKMLEKFGELQT